jgi:hypothetical protein
MSETAAQKKYRGSEKHKAAQKRYRDSGKKKAAVVRRKYELGEVGVIKRREYALKYYYANLEKCRVQSAARKRKQGLSPKEKQSQRAAHLKKKFGISTEEYEALLVTQNGVCAVCRNSCPSGRRLAIDHCHVTGKIRGLLCTPCNTAIGLAKEDTLRLRALIDYIERHKCL